MTFVGILEALGIATQLCRATVKTEWSNRMDSLAATAGNGGPGA